MLDGIRRLRAELFQHLLKSSTIFDDQLAIAGSAASRASRAQWKLGLRLAPLVPQAWQVKRGSMSDSRTSSGH